MSGNFASDSWEGVGRFIQYLSAQASAESEVLHSMRQSLQ